MSWIADMIFGRRDTVPAPRPMIGFPADGGLIPAGVTAITALGISSVWRCLDILANGISQLEWSERRGNLELPPSRLVRRPQAQRTRREWVSIVVSTLALYDVCYLLKVGSDAEGVPVSLLYLQPSIVTPALYDQFGLFPPTEYFVLGRKVSADDLVILHRSPQPGVFDTVSGVISLARATFAAAIAAENYASRYWQAGGSPTTYLTTEGRLPDPEAQKISERWAERRMRGPDYAPVLTNGLEVKDFGADPTSASAVEARRELVADVGRYFGIGSSLLNSPNQSSETYSTTEAEGIHLARFTLQNYIGAIEDAITDQLPGGRHLAIPIDPLTRGLQYARAQSWNLALGNKPWMTQDEVREAEGLPPIENPADLAPIPAPAAPAIAGGPNGTEAPR